MADTPPAAAVLAIDGGNSKTDVALVAGDGTLLASARGPGINAHEVGVDQTMMTLNGAPDGRVTRYLGITVRLAETARHAIVRVIEVPPVAGAALLGLDHVHSPPAAQARLRTMYLNQLA